MRDRVESGYDVIVIGAGSAGAALAGRLTEDEGRRVLVLEAGPDYRSTEAPEAIRSVAPGSIALVQTFAETHTYRDLVARRSSVQDALPYVRGRGVGGSSAINGLFAIRPTVDDLDGWAKVGCTGWGHEDVLPLLVGMERDLDFGDAPYHGTDGPTPIRRPRREDLLPVDAAIDRAAERLGHPWAPDHNAPGSTGASPYAFNGSEALERVSTNDAYLEPARGRPGLEVRGGAVVDRVVIQGGRAVGVVATIDGRREEIRASEVVVAAGAIHSPAILQRSGVGPSALLDALGIDVVADLGVGAGLQEHAGISGGIVLHEPIDYGSHPQRGQICIRFSTGVGDEADDGMIATCGALGLGVPVGAVVGWVNRVTSRGTVQITTTDPGADPRVEFDMLATGDDRARYRRVVDELRAMLLQPEVQELALATSIGLTGTAPQDVPTSDEAFAAFALANVTDVVHATSTCRMGDPGDPEVVVDPDGRVLGIDGLRVADASILPWVPRANTNLTAILVGERIAASMRGPGSGAS